MFAYSDKTVTPKSVDDVKLIHAGRILENNTTLADARVTMGDLPTGVITMHIVVQPSVAKKKKGLFSFSSFISGMQNLLWNLFSVWIVHHSHERI